MAASEQILDRLSRATDYGELQSVFSDIADVARSTSDGSGLASLIDQAIHRIERERIRDEDELRTFESKYESFREQQKGVIGWFKRHIPFTETRRQEKEHREILADQRAEILADNLIIARAQMLKEQLLPVDQRRLGQLPQDWERRLRASETIEAIAEFANTTSEMAQELFQAGAFITQLSTDIENFAAASFADAVDQERKTRDLAAARGELELLNAEFSAKQTIRAAALESMRNMITVDLANRNPDYRGLVETSQRLADAAQQAMATQQRLQKVRERTQKVAETAQRIEALPTQREQLKRERVKLENSLDQKRQARTQADSHAGSLRQQVEEAKAKLQNAEAAESSAEREFKSDTARTGQAELEPGTTWEQSSPAAANLAAAKTQAEAKRDRLKAVKNEFDAAEKNARRAEQDVGQIETQLKKNAEEQEKLKQEEATLGGERDAAIRDLQPDVRRLHSEIDHHIERVRSLGWTSTTSAAIDRGSHRVRFGPNRFLPESESNADLSHAAQLYEALFKATKADLDAIEQQLAANRESRGAAWSAHCRTMIGEDLARELAPPA